MKRTRVAAFLVALLGAQGAAHGDRIAIIAQTTPGAPLDAAAVQKAAAGAVREGGDEPVLDALEQGRARFLAGAVPRGALADFARVRDLVEAGWQAYLAVDPDRARELLAQARTVADSIKGLPGAAKVRADIALRLGAIALSRGDTETARAELARARALDPDRTVTIATFPPEVVTAYAAATPEPTVVSGEPRVVSGAATGEPRVVGEARKLPESLAQPPKLGTGAPAAAGALAAVILYAEVDAAVVVAATWRRGQPAALAQACKPAGDRLACGRIIEVVIDKPAPVAAGQAVSAALSGALAALATADQRPTLLADPRLFPGEGPPPPTAPSSPDPLWKSPYLWIGVGTAALATAATLFLIAGDDEPAPRITVDVCDTFVTCAP